MAQATFDRFSVFFPMWNEEEYLQRALNAAVELGDELIANGTIRDYEMIIVNDASTDATPALADAAAAANPRV
jgi:glycosyltransferase involved in cell wall biosynthesis